MNTHHTAHTPHTIVGNHPDRLAASRDRVAVRPTEEPSRQAEGGFSSALRKYFTAWGITALLGLLFVSVATLILYNSSDPIAGVLPAAAVALALASAGGGIAAGRLMPSTPVTAGLICGVLTGVLLLMCSLIWGNGGIWRWCMSGEAILLHLLGGLIARPRKKTPTHTAGRHHSHR